MNSGSVGTNCQKLWPESDLGCAASLIRHHARRIVHICGFPKSELDEYEQRLLIELWRKRTQYDARRGPWCVFASVVVCNAASKILREQFAQRRNAKKTASLNQRVRCDKDSVEFADLVDCDGRRTSDHTDAQREIDLAMDVASLVNEFPLEWQGILQLLTTKTVAQVSKETNVPRVIIRLMIHQVRKRFEKAQMQKYF